MYTAVINKKEDHDNDLYMPLMVYKINILNLHILLVIKRLLSKAVTSISFLIKDLCFLLPIKILNNKINNNNLFMRFRFMNNIIDVNISTVVDIKKL